MRYMFGCLHHEEVKTRDLPWGRQKQSRTYKNERSGLFLERHFPLVYNPNPVRLKKLFLGGSTVPALTVPVRVDAPVSGTGRLRTCNTHIADQPIEEE